jgi:23S rRNA-/tRNA-specific pseudouridylate synthase
MVVAKPPGWLSQPDGTHRPDLLRWASGRLAAERRRPNAWVGLVHRLDRVAGGAVVLAKTSKAAARLSAQFRARTVSKTYLALVPGPIGGAGPAQDPVRLDQLLVRERGLTRPAGPGEAGTMASLLWRPLADGRLDGQSCSLVQIALLSGLRHQIRAQLASQAMPIWGDGLYGGPPGPPEGGAIGLWAARLEFDHPVGGRRLSLDSAPAGIWPWSGFEPADRLRPDP